MNAPHRAERMRSRAGLSEAGVANLEALDRVAALRDHLNRLLTGELDLDPMVLESLAGMLAGARRFAELAWDLRRRDAERARP